MPDITTPSALVKVHKSSRLAFGATTAALVTLASGGTAVLVANATHGVSTPTSLPPGALPPDAAASPDGLVVDKPAGTATPAAPVDPTERAIHDALTARHTPRRTLIAPLVPLAPGVPPAVPDVPDAVDAPVIGPVVEPDPFVPAYQAHRGKHHADPEAEDPREAHGQPRPHHTNPSHGRHAHPRAQGKGRHAR